MEEKQIIILGIVAVIAIVFLVFLFHGQIVANAVSPGGFKMPSQKKFDASAMNARFLQSAQASQGAVKSSAPAWTPGGMPQSGKSAQLPYYQPSYGMPQSNIQQQQTMKTAYEKQQEAIKKMQQAHAQKMAAIRRIR